MNYQNSEIKNEIALVTGGSKGIGKEISKRLAAMDITTWIASRTQSDIDRTVNEINNAGGSANGYQVDVSNPVDLEEMISYIHDRSGQIDILVNNAGIGQGGQKLWETDTEKWWKVMEVNVRGPMVLCNLVLPGMIEQNWGTVINLASFSAIRPQPMSSAYGISKTALTRMTDTLAASLEETNIGIFPISPGLVYTDMTKDVPVFKDLPDEAWTPVEEAGKLVTKLVSGRYHPLSGRFIHVNYDVDDMLSKVEQIKEDNVYTLRLAKLNGLED